MSGLILPDLKTDFLNSSRFTTADIARILTPISNDSIFVAPGQPLVIGSVPGLLTPDLWPSQKTTDVFSLRDPKNIKDILASLSQHKRSLMSSFYEQLVACIPEDRIAHIDFSLSDDWQALSGKDMREFPHLDNEGEDIYTFTVTAAFPNPTVFYPDLSAGHYLAWNNKGPLPPGMAREYSPKPAEMVLWNDHRSPHRSPVNGKTFEEWCDMLEDYPGHEKILQPNGSVRRLFIRAIVQVRDVWMQNVLHANQMKLEIA